MIMDLAITLDLLVSNSYILVLSSDVTEQKKKKKLVHERRHVLHGLHFHTYHGSDFVVYSHDLQ